MQESNISQNTQTQQQQQQDVQRKQYIKPEMTEQKPLDRATTTVYYFYE